MSATPQQQAQQALLQANSQGNAQLTAAIIQKMPALINLARQGLLNETQLTQLGNLAKMYGAQSTVQRPVVAGPSAAASTQPPAQASQPAAQTIPQLQAQTQAPAQATPAQQQAQLPATSQNVAAGQKRKSPMPESNSTPQAAAAQLPSNIFSISTAGFPNLTSTATPAGSQVTAVLNTTNPGPQAWPNTAGPRPSLNQGLAAGSALMGTPTHITRGQDSLDTLTALDSFKKDSSSSASHDPQMRRTIKDLVAGIDPNVKIDREVEDMLLDMADEFIDSVTNFACRLAKHRGSDMLDVKDLQLHLERNHNIRIPGFSSDETRLAISHSNPATGHQAPKAPKVDTKASSSKPESEGGKDKDKAGNKDKGSKNKAAKAKDVQSNVALRAARLAAVKALK